MAVYGLYENAVSDNGDPTNMLQGATVKVYNLDTLVFASIFSDAAGAVAINQTTNPIVTGTGGYFKFFVAPGTYDVYTSYSGYNTVKTTITVSAYAALRQRTVTADTAFVPGADEWIWVNAASGPVVITLPAFNLVVTTPKIGRIDNSANAVSVVTPDGKTIDGLASMPITNQYEHAEFGKDDTEWHVF